MKRTFIVLTAALATVAFAPRSRAQEANKMTVVAAVRAPAQTDTMSVVIAVPEAATIDTVKKSPVRKARRE